jgi:hypothetical protein
MVCEMHNHCTITDNKGAKRYAHLLVVKKDISLWISRYSPNIGEYFFYEKVESVINNYICDLISTILIDDD